MTYEETCEWLFTQTANYESQGKDGYKPGLEAMLQLDSRYGEPHRKFRSILVAGTNGKGSVSHTLAADLQVNGYKVGLYTSPHLLDFSERIRVNGQPISQDYVVKFVEEGKNYFQKAGNTFFEIATEMAFNYFADNDVDIAIIEVGLGGRLDSTNIIMPILSIITNVSLDHTHILGSSVEQIAMEKAGIIKKDTPVVIGEATSTVRPIFEALANERHAPIYFAEDNDLFVSCELLPEDNNIYYKTRFAGDFKGQLFGEHQIKNTRTILIVLHLLDEMGYLCPITNPKNIIIIQKELNEAFLHVCDITGLKGRWQTISRNPLVVCDIGHNVGAWQYLSQQIAAVKCRQRHVVFGMVDDKDIYGVMSLLPKDAIYYFTKPNTHRALSEQSIQVLGQQFNLNGNSYPTVDEAFAAAKKASGTDDFIFVGGSNYVVADFLKNCI